MAKRYKMNKKKSKRSFTKAAMKTHKKNRTVRVMRGGYRI